MLLVYKLSAADNNTESTLYYDSQKKGFTLDLSPSGQVMPPAQAVELIKTCGVESRRVFMTNDEIAMAFHDLRHEEKKWHKSAINRVELHIKMLAEDLQNLQRAFWGKTYA